jgi:hypothetical protein
MIITDKKTLVKYVSAFVLGDGGLFKNSTPNSNARYMLSQSAIHMDYVLWQQSILNNLTSSEIYKKAAYVDKNNWRHNDQVRLQTKSLPFFTTIRNRWYVDNKKVVSPHDLKLLDAEMLAILYMDDGSLATTSGRDRKHLRVDISTQGYSWDDNNLLRDEIANRLGIHFDVGKTKYPSGIKYKLTLRHKYVCDFIDIIKPYILPSFAYKIKLSHD